MATGRKIGKTRVSRHYVDDCPKEIVRMLAGTIPVRAETIFYDDTIEYVLICDQFDPVRNGESLPDYEAVFNCDENGALVWAGWRRRS
jgi:hypothetical protein